MGANNDGDFANAVLSGRLGARRGTTTLPFAPTALDIEFLRIAGAAMAERVPLGVVLPLMGTPAVVVLGAVSVVEAVLHRGKLDVRVGASSARLNDRLWYDQLMIGSQRLSDFVPRAGVRDDGTEHVARARGERAVGRLYLTSRVARLKPVAPRLEGTITDAGAITPEEMLDLLSGDRRRPPFIYLTTDPSDARLAVIRRAGGAIWGWDSACLSALSDDATSRRTAHAGPLVASAETLRAAATASVSIRLPNTTGRLDDALDQLWHAMGRLGAHDPAPPTLRWIWGVFNTFAMLPVQPALYDNEAAGSPYVVNLGAAPGMARAFARVANARARDAWYAAADAIADVYSAAQAEPRITHLIEWVRERAELTRPGVILVRNRIAASALVRALQESPATPPGWQHLTAIMTLSEMTRAGIGDSTTDVCVPGALPRRYGGFLAAPPAASVTLLACGPREGHRTVRQATFVRTALAAIRAEAVTRSAPMLGVVPLIGLTPYDPASSVNIVEDDRPRPARANERAEDDSAWDPFEVDVVAALRDVVARSDDVPEDENLGATWFERSGSPEPLVDVLALQLAPHDADATGLVLMVAPNELMTRRVGDRVSRVAAKALKTGDTLVLVDRAARTDLRVELTTKLAERAEYAALRTLVDFWHQRAARAGQHSMLSQGAILARMTGTRITTASAIGNWIRGTVDGPADGDDVARFARAVSDDLLLEQAQRVVWALRTLHSVNRKVGYWLSVQATTAATRAADGIVDVDLNLHVADLLDAVSEHRVVQVDDQIRSVRVSSVGVLLTPERVAMTID